MVDGSDGWERGNDEDYSYDTGSEQRNSLSRELEGFKDRRRVVNLLWLMTCVRGESVV